MVHPRLHNLGQKQATINIRIPLAAIFFELATRIAWNAGSVLIMLPERSNVCCDSVALVKMSLPWAQRGNLEEPTV